MCTLREVVRNRNRPVRLLALALSGSYTPAIMLVAQELPPSRRGRAVGMLLMGSSLGYFFAIASCAGLASAWGYGTLWLALSVFPLLALSREASPLDRPRAQPRQRPTSRGSPRPCYPGTRYC
jgi:MFS family permease